MQSPADGSRVQRGGPEVSGNGNEGIDCPPGQPARRGPEPAHSPPTPIHPVVPSASLARSGQSAAPTCCLRPQPLGAKAAYLRGGEGGGSRASRGHLLSLAHQFALVGRARYRAAADPKPPRGSGLCPAGARCVYYALQAGDLPILPRPRRTTGLPGRAGWRHPRGQRQRLETARMVFPPSIAGGRDRSTRRVDTEPVAREVR